MKFHREALRLTSLYLAILMSISIFFSAVIYQLSTAELARGLRRPIEQSIPNDDYESSLPGYTRDALQRAREDIFLEARDHVFQRLVVTNLIILIAAGMLSYYLAIRTLKPIEEANEALERFTADASHELRTPLAAMQSEIEVTLMDPKLSVKDAKHTLNSNLEELAKITALLEGLLKLAHHENGDLSFSKIPAENVINHALKRVKPLASKKNITISQPENTQFNIMGDEVSLTEVLIIVLDNAVKYSPKDTTVEIAVSKKQKHLELKVTDHGIGIKPTELPHIFERFYRADSARSKNEVHGYGIGLALAKHIIDLHHGSINANSKPNKGSTFIIQLPLA